MPGIMSETKKKYEKIYTKRSITHENTFQIMDVGSIKLEQMPVERRMDALADYIKDADDLGNDPTNHYKQVYAVEQLLKSIQDEIQDSNEGKVLKKKLYDIMIPQNIEKVTSVKVYFLACYRNSIAFQARRWVEVTEHKINAQLENKAPLLESQGISKKRALVKKQVSKEHWQIVNNEVRTLRTYGDNTYKQSLDEFKLGMGVHEQLYTAAVAEDSLEKQPWLARAYARYFYRAFLDRNSKPVVPLNLEKAKKLLLEAIKHGDMEAQNELIALEKSIPTTTNVTHAPVKILNAFATTREVPIQHTVKILEQVQSLMHPILPLDKKDFPSFVEFAKKGNAIAQYYISKLYLYGYAPLGVIQNQKVGVEWLRKAGENGYLIAQQTLEMFYSHGLYGCVQNIGEAQKWFKLAFSQDPSYKPTEILLSSKEKKVMHAAEKEFRKGQEIEVGLSKSNDLLFSFATAGKTPVSQVLKVTEHNFKVLLEGAIKHYTNAVYLGHIKAQFSLGLLYEKLERYKFAINWYQKSASAGDPEAQAKLGDLYFNGKRVEKNIKKAIFWYRAALEQFPQDSTARQQLEKKLKDVQAIYQEELKATARVREPLDFSNSASSSNTLNPEPVRTDRKLESEQLVLPVRSIMYRKTPVISNKILFHNALQLLNNKLESEALSLFKEAAEKGHPKAQYYLGKMFLEGIGVEGLSVAKKIDNAIFWLKKSAKRRNVQAQFALGKIFEDEVIRKKELADFNRFQSVLWYTRAARSNCSEAQNALKRLVPQSSDQPKKEYTKSERRQCVESLILLKRLVSKRSLLNTKEISPTSCSTHLSSSASSKIRILSEKNDDIEMTIYEAEKSWLKKEYFQSFVKFKEIADQNILEAQVYVGYCYEHGKGVSKDLNQSMLYYNLASAQNQGKYYYHLGSIAQADNHYKEAFGLYEKALALGDKSPLYEIATCYEYGIAVAKNLKCAFELYKQGTEHNVIPCWSKMGYFYQMGMGVPKDLVQAMKAYGNGVEKGSFSAKYNLACCYQYGIGVQINLQAALKLYEELASVGYKKAFYQLGLFYEKGFLVKENLEKARAYYKCAAEYEHRSAQKALDRLNGGKSVSAFNTLLSSSSSSSSSSSNKSIDLPNNLNGKANVNLSLVSLNNITDGSSDQKKVQEKEVATSNAVNIKTDILLRKPLKGVKEVINILLEHTNELWLVGGAVRDCLLEKQASDFDFVMMGDIEKIKELFKNSKIRGHKNKSLHLKIEDIEIDICFFDSKTSHEFSEALQNDSTQRDFTINSIYWNMKTGLIFDPWKGQDDLINKKITMIGDISSWFWKCFKDPVKLLRALRIEERHQFLLHPSLKSFFDNETIINAFYSILESKLNSEIKKFIVSFHMGQTSNILKKYNLLEVVSKRLPGLFNSTHNQDLMPNIAKIGL